MKRPLVAVVVAYGLGLLLAQVLHPPLRLLFLFLGLLLVLVVGLRSQRSRLLWPLLAVLGWANLAMRTDPVAPTDLRVLLRDRTEAIVTVRGTLAETPRLKMTVRNGETNFYSLVRLDAGQLKLDGAYQSACGQVEAVSWSVLGPEFFAGEPVEVYGLIGCPAPPPAEGLFDYPHYLATRGIHYVLGINSWGYCHRLEPHAAGPPLTDRFLNWARRTLALGLPEQDQPLQLLWAMTLGWRTAFTGDVGDPFLQAGTMHMFAIDGLRIAMLTGMFVALFRLAGIPRWWCGGGAIPLIWFYTAATGWETSAIRASVMMTIVMVGWMLKRPFELLNSLAAAALVILLWDPRQVFEAGFQLSFCVMLVIGVVLPAWNAVGDRALTRWLGPDPLLPESLAPRWRKFALRQAGRCLRYCGVSLAAWMGSMPLSAAYFHLFSPVSIVANLFAVPAGALALMANLAALLCGQWLPWATVLFNHAAWGLMWLMTWLSVKFAGLPGAYAYVAAPSVPAICLYYAAVVAAFSGWLNTRRRRIAGGLGLLLMGALALGQWLGDRGQTRVTVLPLNGGHAVYVDAAGRRNDWLINCGDTNAVKAVLADYLHGQGVNSLPRLLLADGNERNCGGAAMIGRAFGIGELWTAGVDYRSAGYRRTVAELEKGWRPPGARHHLLRCGGTNGAWRVLYPPAMSGPVRADDAAVVLLGDFHGTRVLLLSELGRDGQSRLLGGTNDVRADIVIAGLPDEGEPLCDSLLMAVRPRVIVIADSDGPAARRARRPLEERLGRTGVPVLYTSKSRAVKICAGAGGWKVRAMDGQEYASGPAGSGERGGGGE